MGVLSPLRRRPFGAERLTRVIRIALLPGDGIGPEVVREARRVLEAAQTAGLIRVEFEEFPHGADHYLATGETLGEETFARLRDDFPAILLGAVGDARVPDGAHARDILLGLRFGPLQDLLRVTVGLGRGALLVLLGCHHVVEGVLYRNGGLDDLETDAVDPEGRLAHEPGLLEVGVESGLQDRLRLLLDPAPLLGEGGRSAGPVPARCGCARQPSG